MRQSPAPTPPLRAFTFESPTSMSPPLSFFTESGCSLVKRVRDCSHSQVPLLCLPFLCLSRLEWSWGKHHTPPPSSSGSPFALSPPLRDFQPGERVPPGITRARIGVFFTPGSTPRESPPPTGELGYRPLPRGLPRLLGIFTPPPPTRGVIYQK